jgi:DNA (cytosine-5)-methyltransferase 1
MRKAVSLFAGAGGFCEGVRMAGFRVLCAVETDASARKTHAANFKNVALFAKDIVRFLRDKKDARRRSELTQIGIDLVYGGPPCQGFSQIGPRKLNDPRNRLYKEFVRVVRLLQPSVFVMENVPNMLAMNNGHFRSKIQSAFSKAGYRRTAVLPLVASDFGVPQHRHRVFVFGLKDGLRLKHNLEDTLKDFIAKEMVARIVTVGEALSDLPARVSTEDQPLRYPKRRRWYSDYQRLMRLDCNAPLLSSRAKRRGVNPDRLHNHHTKDIEARRKRILKAIPPGGNGSALSPKLWSGVRAGKWRRLNPKKPSYTILAQMHRDLSEWIHPKHDRWITVREAARLQSFHDGFIFYGSEVQQLKQVGNAVPPLMAFAVARATKQLLTTVRSNSRRKRHRRKH